MKKDNGRYCQWLYIFGGFLLMISMNNAMAINFTGEWTWVSANADFNRDKFIIQQDNLDISGSNQTECGLSTMMGASNETKISLQLSFNSNKKHCPSWIVLNASCSDDNCSTIQGVWYDSNHLMGNLTWVKNNKKFYISDPKENTIFTINRNVNMPSLHFIVTSDYPPAPLKWSLKIDYRWRRGSTGAVLPATITNINEYIPDISSWNIIGGDLVSSAIYNSSYSSNRIAIANYKIYGTNPGKLFIDSEIKDTIQSKIACVESDYRQFDAAREDGQGLPLIGLNDKKEKVGGVGIMQVINEKVIPSTV